MIRGIPVIQAQKRSVSDGDGNRLIRVRDNSFQLIAQGDFNLNHILPGSGNRRLIRLSGQMRCLSGRKQFSS